MKKCPYCREEIIEDALKCRYCASNLHPIDTNQSSQDTATIDKVTYIVDRGLLRFGKFAGASLAIFLIVGAYLFGFKLDDAVEKLRDSQAEIAKAQASLETAQAELDQAKATVGGLAQEVRTLLRDARQHLGDIRQHRTLAEQIIGTMRVLETGVEVQLTAIQETSDENVNLARVPSGPVPDLWAVGTTIQISFMDGTESQRRKVKDVAKEWLSYANIIFEFRDDPSAVRISFAQQGNWTHVGTTALTHVPSDQPTMNLGSIELTAAVSSHERGTILHEFGHLLGLIHEHQNPNANLPWDVEHVYSVFTQPPNNWSRATIAQAILDPAPSAGYANYREFDRGSIMNFTISAEFFTDGLGIAPGEELSESDKNFISRLYPNS